MRALVSVVAVAGILLTAWWQTRAELPPPPRPSFSLLILPPRRFEDRLLGVVEDAWWYEDASGSLQAPPATRKARWGELGAAAYYYVLEAAPGSTLTVYLSSGEAGAPARLATYEVPETSFERTRLAERDYHEITTRGPELAARHTAACSPLAADLYRILSLAEGTGRRGAVFARSDFEEQSARFPRSEDLERSEFMRDFPPLSDPAEQALLLHLPTASGHVGGRPRRLLGIFARVLRSWGVREVRQQEALTG
jgi:hypothetical protein